METHENIVAISEIHEKIHKIDELFKSIGLRKFENNSIEKYPLVTDTWISINPI